MLIPKTFRIVEWLQLSRRRWCVGLMLGIVCCLFPLIFPQAARPEPGAGPAAESATAAQAPSAKPTYAGSPAPRQRVEIQTATVEVAFDRSGQYTIVGKATQLRVVGNLGQGVTRLSTTYGSDRLGPYRQIEAVYGSLSRQACMRLYRQRPVVVFLDRHTTADPNINPFPAFQDMPPTLRRASYRVFKFSPIDFGNLDSQGPWLFFDQQGNTMVWSPADNFLVADMEKASDGRLSSGIAPQITTLPPRFTHQTLLAFGNGINRTLGEWGTALQRLKGKPRIANDADLVLNRFGYWTDNGARYYYKFDPQLGYEGTLLAVRNEFQKAAIPLGYMQLDSWWYPKQDLVGKGDDGAMVYRADPKIFPGGLDAFHQEIGLPLVTHGRWIAQKSPYRKQFQMSENVIIDPRFWNGTAAYLQQGGVVVYEQDWLNHNARPAVNIQQSHAYLSIMANAMMRQGIGIQYCMPLPAYFMASTQFANVRTIRTGDDRFKRSRYDTFLYTAALARAVGLWPWSDVFLSGETLNLVLSTLSAGPVGTGDALGAIDADNLRRVMRGDGVILKPDTSLLPLDAMYQEDAATGLENATAPMVAMAQTDFGSAAERYVLSYSRTGKDSEAVVPLRGLGIDGPVYAWNWVSHRGERIAPGGSVHLPFQDGWGYQVLAPIGPSGIALLGDAGKIVPLARKRFATLSTANGVRATIVFSSGESSVTITAYAQHDPHVLATEGTAHKLSYDRSTKVATFTVLPGRQSRARIHIW